MLGANSQAMAKTNLCSRRRQRFGPQGELGAIAYWRWV